MKPEPRQFALLLYFIEHRGEMLSNDMLRRKVWPIIVSEQTVAVAVCKLRAKLEEAGDDTEYIQGVPNEGHYFVCPVTMEKARDVDKELADVKESTKIETVGIKAPDNNKQVVGFVGVELERPEPTLIELKRKLDVHIERLPESERAGIFFDLARRASTRMIGSEQNTYLDMIGDEYESFSAALDHYGKTSANEEMELAVNLSLYWEIRGSWAEGRERLRHALARQGEGVSDMKAKTLTWFGYMSFHLDDYKTAQQALSEGATMSKKIGDDVTFALALLGHAGIAEAQARYPQATKILKRSLEASERGKAYLIMGWTYRMLGSVALAQGDPASAKDYLLKSLAKREEIDDRRGVGNTYSRLSVIAVSQKDLAQARLLLNKSHETAYGTPNKGSVALAQFHLGLIEEGSEQYQSALNAFQRCLALRLEIGEKRGVARAAEATGKMMFLLGKEKDAARMLGAADALRISTAAPLSPNEEKKFGWFREESQKKFLNEWKDGKRRMLEEAIVV